MDKETFDAIHHAVDRCAQAAAYAVVADTLKAREQDIRDEAELISAGYAYLDDYSPKHLQPEPAGMHKQITIRTAPDKYLADCRDPDTGLGQSGQFHTKEHLLRFLADWLPDVNANVEMGVEHEDA